MPQASSLVLSYSNGITSCKDVQKGVSLYGLSDWVEISEVSRVSSSQAIHIATESGLFVSGLPDTKIQIIEDGSPTVTSFKSLKVGQELRYNQDTVSFEALANISFVPNDEVRQRAERDVYLPSIMTDDLARLIGWIEGDANISEDGVALCGPSSDPDKFEYYLSSFERIFQVTRGKVTKRSDSILSTTVGSILIRDWFKYINARSCREDSVPYCILASGTSVWQNYLIGLFETDGSLGDSGHGDGVYVPRLKQAGKIRMAQIAFLLNLLGIGVRLDERKSENKDHQTLYDCVIRGRRSRALFYDLIGKHLVADKKRERSKTGIGDAEDSSTEVDKISDIKASSDGKVFINLTPSSKDFYLCNSLYLR